MKNTFKQNSLYKFHYSFDWLMKHFFKHKLNFLTELNLKFLRKSNLAKLETLGHKGQALKIEERVDLSKEEFISQYLKKNKPVVLKGAAKDWACVKEWTPDLLEQRYGEDKIDLIDASPKINDPSEMDYSSREVLFKEVIAGMRAGDNSLYSRFNDLLGKHEELKNDVDINWFLDRRERIVSGKVFQCFIGGAKTYTHLHTAIQSNFFVEVYGVKRWRLYPPSYNQYLRPLVEGRPYFSTLFNSDNPNFDLYPEMKYLDYYDLKLEPGDILYNPPSWWHHVNNETMSIGVGFRWTSLAATLKASPIQLLLTLCAYNPSMFFALSSRGNFAKVFSYKKDEQ